MNLKKIALAYGALSIGIGFGYSMFTLFRPDKARALTLRYLDFITGTNE